MKIRNLLTAIAASVSAAAILAVGASAYDLNTDLSTFWSASVTVPGSEFADITADSVITITFTTDDSLADMEGHAYWVIKPMINDSGWPLIAGISELTPSEDGSSYTVNPGDTSVSFSIPEADVEHVQVAGIALMGHGLTLGELTVSNDAPVAPAEDNTAVDTDAPTASDNKANADTGVEGMAAVAAAAIVGGAAMVISRKRK